MTVFTVVFDYSEMSETELTTLIGGLVSNKRLAAKAQDANLDRYLKTNKLPTNRWLPPYYKNKVAVNLE